MSGDVDSLSAQSSKLATELNKLKSHTQRSVDTSAGLRSNMIKVEGESWDLEWSFTLLTAWYRWLFGTFKGSLAQQWWRKWTGSGDFFVSLAFEKVTKIGVTQSKLRNTVIFTTIRRVQCYWWPRLWHGQHGSLCSALHMVSDQSLVWGTSSVWLSACSYISHASSTVTLIFAREIIFRILKTLC